MSTNKTFDVNAWVRPNIRAMQPYSSARDEFHGTASVFLDANENPYNAPYNRYPDPMQWRLKEKVAEIKGVPKECILLGNGSDEPIDLILRAFCEPGKECMLTVDPTYGMYQVAAEINNVTCRKVKLTSDFQIDMPAFLSQIDDTVKAIYLCSPNNPTGNSLNRKDIYQILDTFKGIVVVDEAYIDFSSLPSYTKDLSKYPNLVVFQTLSKAWGAAGIRLGMAFASPEIISVLNKIKYPYNVNQLTQEKALEILNNQETMKSQLTLILSERTRLQQELTAIPCVRKIYPTDANFILVDVGDADTVYQKLVDQGIIVRNRNKVVLCAGCLRITVGTEEENTALLNALKTM
ncbi:histidinol-phosphate transaminase [Parabacteroides sp. AD58]|uniref:Histidinol-phosphate aminotransferase n=1 Tax=Parabacteroides absconsus TaxID=2951805 RepID=A0ABZ2IR14_9BACT|nr:histidinol-phosphate transaminase [Parabacteroides sp. AD58]MCM6900906.1 histidinol-phosphate transaminase [Parabacteroides sp. AD58]